MKKTLFISGGGTGGHIWPLIPVGKRLKNSYKIYFVGEEGGDEEKIAKDSGLEFLGLKAAKLQGFSIINPLTYIKQIAGLLTALSYIGKYKPSLVLTKGGYASFPIALAAYIKGVKLVVHESDSIVGRSNRILLPMASRFLTGFDQLYYQTNIQNKAISVGIPVRDQFKMTPFPKSQQILFMGGSQGSSFINKLVLENVDTLVGRADIVHICGRRNYEQLNKRRDELDDSIKDKYRLIPFSDQVAKLIKESSLVVSRSGATSIAEIAVVGRPAIFIPFPYAANDHQLKNARIIESKQAGVLLEEKGLDNNQFIKQVSKLLADYELRKSLADNLHRLMGKDNSADKICRIIESMI